MMNLKLKKLFALAAIFTGGVAHALTVGSPFVELDTDTTLKGNTIRTGLSMNLPLVINQRYSVVVETNNVIGYRDEVNTLTLRHSYLRAFLKDSSLAKFGGWNLGIIYRYTAPTSSLARQAGSFGGLLVRPDLSRDWGKYSLLLRYGVGVHMITSQLQSNAPAGKEPQPNTLGGGTLEIIQGYQITPEISVSPSFIFTNSFAPGKKAPKSRWANSFEQYYEVVYQGAATLNTGVGLYLDHSTSYGKGIQGKLFTKAATAGVRVFRNF